MSYKDEHSESNWLGNQNQMFQSKKSLRDFYGELYKLIRVEMPLTSKDTKIVEIGTGAGLSGEYLGDLNYIKTDAIQTGFEDEVVDAQSMPYQNESLDFIFGVDVFHHLPSPFKFLVEAERCLKPGGKVVLAEPAITPLSWPVYKFLHPEPMKWRVSITSDGVYSKDNVMDANNALPSRIFPNNFQGNLNLYNINLRYQTKLFGFLSMLATGGINSPRTIPVLDRHIVALFKWETRRSPKFSRKFFFRTLIVIEKPI